MIKLQIQVPPDCIWSSKAFFVPRWGIHLTANNLEVRYFVNISRKAPKKYRISKGQRRCKGSSWHLRKESHTFTVQTLVPEITPGYLGNWQPCLLLMPGALPKKHRGWNSQKLQQADCFVTHNLAHHYSRRTALCILAKHCFPSVSNNSHTLYLELTTISNINSAEWEKKQQHSLWLVMVLLTNMFTRTLWNHEPTKFCSGKIT